MKSLMREMVELLKKVGSAEVAAERLIERAYDKGFDNGFEHGKESARQFDLDLKKSETNQEKRDRLVKQAKEFVEGVIGDVYDSVKHEHYDALCLTGPMSVKFHVNDKKRVVTASLFYKHVIGELPRFKGFAKCAPNDCFNEHIGKVIALHRALGLDVPQEYLDVPNPTEVRVGNVVRTNRPDLYVNTPYKVVRVDSLVAYDEIGFIPITDLDIIDDSESESNV